MNNAAATKPYEVLLWGSHPDSDNDDCWAGEDYVTLEEAQACIASFMAGEDAEGWEKHSTRYYLTDTAFFEITGPGIWESLTKNPKFNPARNAENEWRSELQMQSAMAFGVHGWNDYEGC